MYNIGTVTTTTNSPKIIGTGTRWKDNTNLISVGQVIVIKNDTSGLPNEVNTIYSIESNTELTLAFPVSAKLTNAKYAISTTMIDSISDGVNKATAQVIASEIFTDIFTELMTGTGTLDFELPNGQKVKLRTEAERDKLLDGKFDKAGGTVNGAVTVTGLITAKDGTIQAKAAQAEGYVQISISNDGADPVINSKRPASAWRKHSLPDASGTLMQVGDYGWGGAAPYKGDGSDEGFLAIAKEAKTQVFRANKGNLYQYIYSPTLMLAAGDSWASLCVNYQNGNIVVASGLTHDQKERGKNYLYGTANTTKDSQGNLRAASPVIKIFTNHIELNEESEGVELEKIGTGRYKLKGVLGMNSDASWGGIHGGMVIPNGINNLPLVWGSFDVLPDGDIIIETRYRKHELNERQEAERLMTYPEFLKDELVEVDTEEGKKEKLLKVEREDYEYCDIPNGHWIDVRVNMPSNSIYNLKQAEAERLAKKAAEKQVEEEAKRAAEEADSSKLRD
ncbi:hypothetical protein [Providencia stuartii]|uniref:phage tail fiber protein n=1 Tax=Providencia stuartii TaxID=588 RepID=UPI00300C6981